jgi:hypothetical protein
MGSIFNKTNFNAYTGKYSRQSEGKTPEEKIGWSVPNLIEARFSVLALRNWSCENNDEWPMAWKRDKTLDRAVTLTLEILKGWQAFRGLTAKQLEKLVRTMKARLPAIVLRFQNEMQDRDIYRVSDLRSVSKEDCLAVIFCMAKAVGRISSYKNNGIRPMVGSKIMNFFFPEFFPVWDTKWIYRECLSQEDLSIPAELERKIHANGYNKAARSYAEYSWRMLNDLLSSKKEEYEDLESKIIKYSDIPREVIKHYYWDLAPISFEICLLGKYC